MLRAFIPWIATLAVIAAAIIGLIVVGSPAEQRAVRMDERRLADLAALSSAIDQFHQNQDRLPEVPSEARRYMSLPPRDADPVTSEPYEYRVLSDTEFELCAVFATEGPHVANSYSRFTEYTVLLAPISPSNQSIEGAGRGCFTFDTTANDNLSRATITPNFIGANDE